MTDRRTMLDGPVFVFTYLWSGLYPYTYTLDLSGSGCVMALAWDRIERIHELDCGDYKRYQKGFRLNATLRWDGAGSMVKSTFDGDTRDNLTEWLVHRLYQISCNEQCFFYPYPGLQPTNYHDVVVTGAYDMQYIKGMEGFGLKGTITLAGKEVLNEIPYSAGLGAEIPYPWL